MVNSIIPPQLKTWLEAQFSPLSQKPLPYTSESIPTLLERLRPYDLSKGEVIMILNLRPASVAALNTIVEDMAERFNDEQQEELLTIISEVLGQFDPPAEEEQTNGDAEAEAEAETADVSMNDAAETAAS